MHSMHRGGCLPAHRDAPGIERSPNLQVVRVLQSVAVLLAAADDAGMLHAAVMESIQNLQVIGQGSAPRSVRCHVRVIACRGSRC